MTGLRQHTKKQHNYARMTKAQYVYTDQKKVYKMNIATKHHHVTGPLSFPAPEFPTVAHQCVTDKTLFQLN